MYISLTERRNFTAEISGRTLQDLEIESEWNGLTKLVQPSTGLYLIVMRNDGLIVDGTPALMDELLAPAASTGYLVFPRTTLPCGLIVESFQVAQYMNCLDADGKAYVSETDAPTVRINFATAHQACKNAGGGLITGSQHLAIAWDIVNQPENWTGGAVGDGHVYRGLHKGSVSGAQRNEFVSDDLEERRWHVLSTGDRIYDFAGHLFSWMFNDLSSDTDGLAGKIPANSPYLTTASQFSQEQGMGWRPDGARDWSSVALIRGGYWSSVSYAGVFRLNGGWPVAELDNIRLPLHQTHRSLIPGLGSLQSSDPLRKEPHMHKQSKVSPVKDPRRQRKGRARNQVADIGKATAANARRFVAGSVDVIHASSIAAEAHVIDEEIEQMRVEDAAQAQNAHEAQCYRLLRRILIGQANHQFDLGEQLQEIFREVEEKMTNELFDKCMERALHRMGGAA